MNRSWTTLFFTAIALFFPIFAFAADPVTAEGLASGLADDPSVRMLSFLFGDVGGLFGTGETSVLGSMFAIFNAGVMAVGGVLVAYTILSGTLKTAHEGEALGQQWSSIWIPLRSAVGIGMVLPGPGGYALIQVFVMYCAMVGIGLANTVWLEAQLALKFGQGPALITTDANRIVAAVLTSQTCQATVLQVAKQANLNLAALEGTEIPLPIKTAIDGGFMYSYGPGGKCGEIRMPIGSTVKPTVNAIYLAKIAFLEGRLNPDLRKIAALVASGGDVDQVSSDMISNLTSAYTMEIGDIATTAYSTAVAQDDYLGFIKRQGWIFAGSTWIRSAENLKDSQDASNIDTLYKAPIITAFDPLLQTEITSRLDMLKTFRQVSVGANSAMNKNASLADSVSKIQDQLDDAADIGLSDFADGVGPIISKAILSPISSSIKAAFIEEAVLLQMWNGTSANISTGLGGLVMSGSDPIMDLVATGNLVTSVGIGVYMIFGSAVTACAAVNFAGTGCAGPAMTAASYFGPFITTLMLSLVTSGMSLSTYLPLLPTIFWITSVAGWFVLMIESMVAAPIWAVMHASPEGHEWSGKGASGYMIVLGVVLRPVLMIFGLVSAMLVIKVFLTFAKLCMSMAVQSLGASGPVSGFMGPLAMIVIFFIYVWLTIKLFNRALQVIAEIPGGIMKWIGGANGDHLGENPAQEGEGFMKSVMGRGEGAAQAGQAAKKGGLDKTAAEANRVADKADKAAQTAALISAFKGDGSHGTGGDGSR